MAQAALPLMVGGQLIRGIAGYQAGAYNAQLSRNQAREEEMLGAAEASRIRAEARQTMGRQVAGFAESGFQPGTGSALTTLEESLINRETDVLTARRNAAGRAAGLRSQARMQKRQATFALIGAGIDAASTIAGHRADYGGGTNVGGG